MRIHPTPLHQSCSQRRAGHVWGGSGVGGSCAWSAWCSVANSPSFLSLSLSLSLIPTHNKHMKRMVLNGSRLSNPHNMESWAVNSQSYGTFIPGHGVIPHTQNTHTNTQHMMGKGSIEEGSNGRGGLIPCVEREGRWPGAYALFSSFLVSVPYSVGGQGHFDATLLLPKWSQ